MHSTAGGESVREQGRRTGQGGRAEARPLNTQICVFWGKEADESVKVW